MMTLLSHSVELLVGLAILLMIKSWVDERKANPKRLPLPPGPKPAWLIGNVQDMPASFEWITYAEWGRKYGDIVHVKVFDKHIMILNTVEAMNEIFDKRSALYSDRPRLPMLNELMKWTWAFTLMYYGPMWRRSRKMFHQYFHAGAITKYQSLQTLEVRKLLLRLINTPEEFMQIIRHTFASTIMQVSYGIKIRESDDSYVDIAEKVMGSIAVAGNPGAFLVDTIPILKYVPAWFPGAGFQIKARNWAALMPVFVNRPVDEVKAAMAAGTAVPSVATSLLEQVKASEDPELEETIAKGVLAVSYAGGADTTVSTIQTFFLTMVLYPGVQRRAQEQLDAVVGRDRLPTFEDIEALPYIQAVVKEMLRWHPVTPLAIVHRGMANDEYNGYFIPKGSLVVGNAWAILHDERTYPDPMEFKPDRFLHEDGSLNPLIQDPEIAAFGFGRRICPGRHFAINSALISIASILSIFNIEQEITESGEPAVREAKMSSGLLCYPLPFRCKITPRSSNAVTVVKHALDLYE